MQFTPACDFHRLILAFTTSTNRLVINSTVASSCNWEGVSCCKAEASAHTPTSRWGFCSFIPAGDDATGSNRTINRGRSLVENSVTFRVSDVKKFGSL